jgi:hypothetical protein
VEGALHAVLQNGCSAEIASTETFMELLPAFPVVILPETDRESLGSAEPYLEYLRSGGCVVAAGQATAAFDALAGVAAAAMQPADVVGSAQGALPPADAFLADGSRTVRAVGQMRPVRPSGSSRSSGPSAELLHEEFYLLRRDSQLPGARSDLVACRVVSVGEGTLVCIYSDFFSGYAQSHYPGLRRFFGRLLEMGSTAAGSALVKVEGDCGVVLAPRSRGDELLCHLTNLSVHPQTTPQSTAVERVPPTGPLVLQVPTPDRPRSVSLEPGGGPLDWEWDGSFLQVRIPSVHIHACVAIR